MNESFLELFNEYSKRFEDDFSKEIVREAQLSYRGKQEMAKAVVSTKFIFDSMIEQGFTEDQAFKMIGIMLSTNK